ncbi:MAG: ABC transporter ATP-binding protein, partial [Clostridiales bacterium]|nr:ABC transporter ATP-binding protein [Clostridiales bacterium]
LDPAKRNIGMVFQNYAIFPHLTVRQNVEFGLRYRRMPKAERRRTAEESMQLMQIAEFADRMPERLSGGQQQRVALARALCIEPDVLLMDEPLSNLDAKLRVEMRNVIKRIQHQIGITTVYVTHDQEEALAVSDRIAVMHDGVIQQIGTPKRVYQRPANEFVAGFIGLTNFLKADCKDGTLDFGNNYRVAIPHIAKDAPAAVTVAARPEEIVIADACEPGIPAEVRSSVFLGTGTHYFLDIGGEKEVEVTRASDFSDIIPDGTKVSLQIAPEKVNVFGRESHATLIREGV